MITTLLGRMLLVASVLAGVTLTSAAADPGRLPSSRVTLSVQDNHSGEVRTTVLSCHPAGGSHPHAQQACETLTAAKGDFDALKPQTTQCPLIHKPVTVSAHGTWRHEPLHFTKTFSNACVTTAQTEGVFDF